MNTKEKKFKERLLTRRRDWKESCKKWRKLGKTWKEKKKKKKKRKKGTGVLGKKGRKKTKKSKNNKAEGKKNHAALFSLERKSNKQ